MFGRDPEDPAVAWRTPSTYSPEMRYDLINRIYNGVRTRLLQNQEEYGKYRSKKVKRAGPIRVGARVFLLNTRRKSKLDKTWLGPYRVLEKVGPMKYTVKDLKTGKKETRHLEHLKVREQSTLNTNHADVSEPFPERVLEESSDDEAPDSQEDEEDEAEDHDSERGITHFFLSEPTPDAPRGSEERGREEGERGLSPRSGGEEETPVPESTEAVRVQGEEEEPGPASPQVEAQVEADQHRTTDTLSPPGPVRVEPREEMNVVPEARTLRPRKAIDFAKLHKYGK